MAVFPPPRSISTAAWQWSRASWPGSWRWCCPCSPWSRWSWSWSSSPTWSCPCVRSPTTMTRILRTPGLNTGIDDGWYRCLFYLSVPNFADLIKVFQTQIISEKMAALVLEVIIWVTYLPQEFQVKSRSMGHNSYLCILIQASHIKFRMYEWWMRCWL